MIIGGSGFVAPVKVTFGGVNAPVTSVNDTSISVVSPAAGLNQGSAVDVKVTNTASGASGTLRNGFQYDNTQFYISSISPTSGPYSGGTAVVITGLGFVSPVEVRFGGVTQPGPVVRSTSEIDVTTAAATVTACNPPSGTVSVTNLSTGKTATSTLNFSYTVTSPQLTSLSSASGPQAGGNTITVNGSGFGSSVTVTFGSVPSQSLGTPTASSVSAKVPAYTGTLLTEDCDDNHDGTVGKRNLPTAVDVTLTNSATGCGATLTKGYTYNPTDTTCVGDVGSGGGSPPVADFTFRNSTVISPPVANAVDFFDLSSNNPTSWVWDFGDPTSGSANNVSQEQNPTHVFMGGNRTYTVKLTAKNTAGTGSITKSVTIPLP